MYSLKNIKVVIRADGSHLIGMGHLFREIAIASELKSLGADVVFCMRDFKEGVAFIKEKGFFVERIAIDEKQNAEAIVNLKPDILVHDFLETDMDYMDRLKVRMPKCFFVGFDDLGSGNKLHHVLFDANRKKTADKNCFFGADYIILREEISALGDISKEIKDKAFKILVLFGGSDPACLTLKLVKDWSKDLLSFDFSIVLGPGVKDKKIIVDHFKENIIFYENLDSNEMASLMKDADMALCSGGIAMFELACAGVPSIVLAQNRAEVVNMHLFSANKIIADMGLGEEVNRTYLLKTISDISSDFSRRTEMSENGKKYVDGKGLKRIIEIISGFKNNLK